MKKRFLKCISTLLVLVLLANMLPLQIFAENLQTEAADLTTETDKTITQPLAPEEATVVAEITENRTEYSKEFLLSNGLYMASVYADPVHYETETGWEEIDNTLKANRDGSYSNTAGVWDVTFPEQLGEDESVTIQKDGYTLSFSMSGELTGSGAMVMSAGLDDAPLQTFGVTEVQPAIGEIQEMDTPTIEQAEHPEAVPDKLNAQITYEEVYANTDIVYDLDSNTVKESMILESYDPDLQGYSYTLEVGTMIPVLDEDGTVTLYDENQENIIMVMPAPYLIDNSGVQNHDIQVQLVGSGNTYTLMYLLPTEWLEAEDRSWPVLLDPLIQGDFSARNIQDRTIASDASYKFDSSILETGYTDKDDYSDKAGIHRSFLQYETLPAITSADVVAYAVLDLYKMQTSSNTVVVEAHKVNESWTSTDITWNEQPDWEADIEDYQVVRAAGYYRWEITDIVRDWYATTNNGIMFKADTDTEQGGKTCYQQFASSDLGNTGTKPVLYVFFRNNNGLESYWDYTTSSAGRAGTGYVNNYTGNLVWVREDMGFGGNRMPVTISHIYNLNDSANNEFGLGYGWRTNYNQLINTKTLSGVTYYVWEDSDGTDHYFQMKDGKYRDEDGLELTLTINNSSADKKYCITDKAGNCSYFDTAGRLRYLTNNQATKSSITISYRNSTSLLIETITDGVGRVYDYVYSNDFLSKIQYLGTGTEVLHEMVFIYTSSCLVKIRDYDGKDSDYTYSGKLLTSASDIDDYLLTYTYTQGAGNTWQPYRVQSVEESDKNASGNTVQGGKLTFAYAHNQTTVTDYNGKKQVYQFNDFGNTVSVRDDEGRGQFASYARNNRTDTAGKGNQLKVASQLQTTVGNLLPQSSFESGNYWASNATSTLTVARNNTEAYQGSYSLKLVSTATSTVAALSPSFSVAPGETVTFSAYIKSTDAGGCLGIYANNAVTTGGHFNAGMDWTRLQVSYTNNTQTAHDASCGVFTSTTNAIYVDCVQFEKATTASRYNLIENGDFRHTTAWQRGSNLQSTETYVTDTAAAPVLDNRVYKIVGSPALGKHLYQQVKVSGKKGDTYVLAGWAKGDSVPLTESTGRRFALVAYFQNKDGTVTERILSFNPDCPGTWQYAAIPVIAEQDYSAINIDIQYDYNANTAYFDGIQLFREEFGNSYTYDDKGNVTSAKDLQGKNTTYEYDTNNNLTKIIQDNAAKMTYTYDDYHNVKTATTDEGICYTFVYDDYGNNEKVSVGTGTNVIRTEASYTDDKNYLKTTKDALGKVTTYQYNTNTGVLEWVKYPNDTDNTKTTYTYDTMYRTAKAACTTDTGLALSAEYAYTDDLLTKIKTPSTTYNFTYGAFDLRTGVSVGNRTLATYHYTEETVDDRRYDLDRLDYGNGDSVQYEYDDEQRLIKQTYEDGTYVAYTYNNDGDIYKVYDSQSGITTTYTYDLTGRTVKVSQSGTNHSHTISYAYDENNNLSGQTEVVNGTTHTYAYTYDDDNRITKQTVDGVETDYTYDAFGRNTGKTVKKDNFTINQDTYTFSPGPEGGTSGQVATHTQIYAGYTITYEYTYDDNGNIIEIDDGLYTTSYVYDSLNQLLRENNQIGGYTHTWTYNSAGNITSRTEYPYTTGDLTGVTPTDTITYTYEDTNWGDLLTAYDGQTLTYDEIGNLTNDGEWTFTWKHGRQLETAERWGILWHYTYNDAGLRTKKDCGIMSFTYVYNGTQLAEMTHYGNTLKFTYDANGTPLTVDYNGTTYYYVTNLQGDVISIRTENRHNVVYYQYDAWGNLLSCTGTMANTLGQDNPLRYRGYVYDVETGLYYLQSRYYDPKWGRFINADGFVSTGQGLTGNNMFVYCGNNPVVYADPAGTARTYSVQMTDTGYNTQARAYYAKEIRDNNPVFSLIKMTKNAKKALWDAYVLSNELQVEQQYQQDMVVRDIGEYFYENPLIAIDITSGVVGVSTGAAGLAATAGIVSIPVAGQVVLGIISLTCGIWSVGRGIVIVWEAVYGGNNNAY